MTPVFHPENITFHLGLHKSASTFLQKIWMNDPRLNCPKERISWRHFAVGNAYKFDLAANRDYLQSIVDTAPHLPCLFTHERLSGTPFTGYSDQKEIAARIKLTVKQPKIILILREQYTFAASCYRQYIAVGGTRSFRNFLFPIVDGNSSLFDLDALHWQHYVRDLFALFGRQNVTVIPFELLKTNTVRFLHAAYRPLNMPTPDLTDTDLLKPINVGLDNAALEQRRNYNLMGYGRRSFRDPEARDLNQIILDQNVRPLGGNEFLAKRALHKEAERLSKGRQFDDSNRVLAELIDQDLDAYGYY